MKKEAKEFMLDFARNATTEFVANGKTIDVPKNCPQEMQDKKGVFVSLHAEGMRGVPGKEKHY